VLFLEIEGKYELDGLFTSISTDIKFSIFGADEDTPVSWGDVVSGTCYYYLRDADGTNVKSGRYFFNTNSPVGASVFSSPAMSVSLVSPDTISGNSQKTLNVSGQTIDFNSGSFARFHNSLYPFSELDVKQVSVFTGSTMYQYDATLTAPPSSWRFLGGAGGYPKYTTSNKVHNSFPRSSYLPISGRTMSYNDIKNYVIGEWNDQNPDDPISESDIPEFDETEPTEQATGDFQPFSIDYNEILGERELESILKETQYILDTTPAESIDFSFPETLPEASVPDASIVSTVGKVFEMHKNIVPPELVTIWGGLAVFAIFFWWLTK
jgi:hypothetical protein